MAPTSPIKAPYFDEMKSQVYTYTFKMNDDADELLGDIDKAGVSTWNTLAMESGHHRRAFPTPCLSQTVTDRRFHSFVQWQWWGTCVSPQFPYTTILEPAHFLQFDQIAKVQNLLRDFDVEHAPHLEASFLHHGLSHVQSPMSITAASAVTDQFPSTDIVDTEDVWRPLLKLFQAGIMDKRSGLELFVDWRKAWRPTDELPKA